MGELQEMEDAPFRLASEPGEPSKLQAPCTEQGSSQKQTWKLLTFDIPSIFGEVKKILLTVL